MYLTAIVRNNTRIKVKVMVQISTGINYCVVSLARHATLSSPRGDGVRDVTNACVGG